MVESSASDLAHDIHMHFITHGFIWNYEDDPRTPSPEEIEEALEILETRLEDEPAGTTIFGGRLVVSKSEDHLDVYVHFGEITHD